MTENLTKFPLFPWRELSRYFRTQSIFFHLWSLKPNQFLRFRLVNYLTAVSLAALSQIQIPQVCQLFGSHVERLDTPDAQDDSWSWRLDQITSAPGIIQLEVCRQFRRQQAATWWSWRTEGEHSTQLSRVTAFTLHQWCHGQSFVLLLGYLQPSYSSYLLFQISLYYSAI